MNFSSRYPAAIRLPQRGLTKERLLRRLRVGQLIPSGPGADTAKFLIMLERISYREDRWRTRLEVWATERHTYAKAALNDHTVEHTWVVGQVKNREIIFVRKTV